MKIKIASCALCVLLCLSLFAGCGDKSGDHGDLWALQDDNDFYGKVFGDNEIISVKVELSETDRKSLCANAAAEEYYPASITVNGITLENVGFRTKGFSSLTTVANSGSDRYGFKVKTDEYVKGQTLEGLDMFVLNGSFADASYMREYLTYAASEYLGAITPFVSFADLYINGELFGFYTMIEAYDDSFVSRVCDGKDAVLYKASSENCTLLPSDDCSGYSVKVGKDEDNANIKKLIEVLNNTTEENKAKLEEIFDVDSALKAWAVNTVLGNYDSYSGSKAHNYYLLFENGKISYVGWDYNMSIGGFSEDNGASVSADVSTGVYNVNSDDRPLISRLLAINEYYERYIGYVNTLCGYFSNIESMTSWLSDKISTHVKNDPSAFYTYEQFTANITKTGTDLTSKTGMTPGGGQQGGQFPGQGSFPEGQDIPTPPDGEFPGGTFDPGQGGGFTPGDGNVPDPPDGSDPGSFPGGQFPGQGGNMPGAGMPGGMMNAQTCSIVDYILQRITGIGTQLGKNTAA